MSTHVQSTRSAHGVHEHSMSTRCAVHGVHRHFLKYSGLHGQCSNSVSWTPWTISRRLLMDSVDSMRTASLIYLFKKNLIQYKTNVHNENRTRDLSASI